MGIVDNIIKYLKDEDYRIIKNASLGFYNKLSDEEYLSRLFSARMGYKLNLNEPRTYSEKLQWLKLYDRRDIYTTMVDKYEVKKYVANIIGSEYVIPTIGVWDSFDDIIFDELPDQFVLKCTHDSGGLIICKDKRNLDMKAARKKINACLRSDYYLSGREWPYKNVKPRIIAEKYMADSNDELNDYKFFAFDGVVRALFIATERQKEKTDVKFDFFDDNFNHLPFKQGHENALICPEKPVCFELMKELASELSKGFPQLRVDLYEVDGHVYFGELTLFHHGGWTKFSPEIWDQTFGDWITLPEKQAAR